MKTSQHFSLVVSSLVVGGTMLFSLPAQSVILQGTIVNLSGFPQIGNRLVLSSLDGAPLTVNSFTSPEFSLTQIDNNNSTAVNLSIVGGLVQPGEPETLIFDVADNPNGVSGIKFLESVAIISTPTGIEEFTLPILSVAGGNSAGASTPFSAYKVVASPVNNGQSSDFTIIFQVPGDQFTIADTSFTAPLQVSSQPISGYVPFDQLNNFGPPTEIVVTPGGSVTVPVTPATPVPEPSVVTSLLAISLGAFLKRKLLKSKTKV